MNKVTFVMHSLEGSGAEHIVVHLASGLAERGYKVKIIQTKGSEVYYPINSQVSVTHIGINNTPL